MENISAVEVEVELLSTRTVCKRIERIEIKAFETTIVWSLPEVRRVFCHSSLVILSTSFRI